MLSRDVLAPGLTSAPFPTLASFKSRTACDATGGTSAAEALSQTKASPVPKTVLVVEDDPISRRILAQLLRASGYGTQATETAEEALRWLEEGRTPGVALIDLDLPGINGMELIQRLRHIAPSTVPVLVTATSEEKLRASLCGTPVLYVRKPVDFKRLLGLLEGLQPNPPDAEAKIDLSGRDSDLSQ